MPLVQLIHYDSVFSTLRATSRMTQWYDYLWSVHAPGRQPTMEIWNETHTFVFQVSRTCLKPPPSRSHPLERYRFTSRQYSVRRFLLLLYVLRGRSSFLKPAGESTLFYQGKDHLLLEIYETDRHDSYVYETDPYALRFRRRTYNPYAPRGRHYRWFSSAFKVLTPSSRCLMARDPDTFLEAVVCPAHFSLSWPNLLHTFVGSRKLLHVPRDGKVFIAPFRTWTLVDLCL